MPVAAVPSYLQRLIGDDRKFGAASPALRFGLLLPIWTAREDQEREARDRAGKRSPEGRKLDQLLRSRGIDALIEHLLQEKNFPRLWAKNDYGEQIAWRKVTVLSQDDKARMDALAKRQMALWQKLPGRQALRLEAVATAPFTTGLGNEHPLENGFAFLNPYGLPYLAGSGVKGVVRQAARELAKGLWGDTRGWETDPRCDWPGDGESQPPPVKLSMLDVLFGRETEEGEQEHFRGALTFWDVIPQIAGDSLMVEIMTPHYSEYYQQRKGDEEEKNSDQARQSDKGEQAAVLSPHDSGKPTPIRFLTVPPGSRFAFHVVCDILHLGRVAPDLAGNDRWKELVQAAFEHAFRWLGFGAKTAVGYGAMKRVTAVTTPQPPQAAEAPPASTAGPVPTQAGTLWQGATLKYNPGERSIVAERGNQRTAPLRGKDAEELLGALGEERAAALRNRRTLTGVNLRIEQQGNLIRIVGLAE
ncbi:MAG: type III-B CRISPR module RAMP protein Cmr6 [Bryobacterales bacterium]|nr:type III-B CRISPR module RAMP protein Cmr6 [Bryobacteraceae bacterium]MDW8129594.1 type III-B CRISPR module RAMP protein Cmr6 [Bryobacterales bacterium]